MFVAVLSHRLCLRAPGPLGAALMHMFVPHTVRCLVRTQAMLATQQNSKVQDGSLVANCVVVLKQYICDNVQGKKYVTYSCILQY